jgi:beta-glucuronidase
MKGRRRTMRVACTLLLLSLCLPAAARERITLTGGWRFQIDAEDLGEKERWFADGFDSSAWAAVPVPRAWDRFNDAMWGYEGVGWYARTLPPELLRPGRVQRLRFGRVMYHTRVWLNGELLGENIGGYLPFEFDLTGKLRAGRPNHLVVRIDNRPRLDWLPASRNIEWVQYGGILEPVVLESTPLLHLADVTVNAVPDGAGAVVRCAVKVASHELADSHTTVRVMAEGAVQSAALAVPAGSSAVAKLVLHLPRAQAWSPETPALYLLRVSLDSSADALTQRFGVRRIETRGRRILLNGKPLHIRGVNRYDELGRSGPNAPREAVIEDLKHMKNAGVNMVRVHFPQSPELIDLYDEMGFLMSEEVTINWWGNGFSGQGAEVQREDILTHAVPFLERMISRDKNHPAIIFWSMCNESATDNEIGIRVMRTLLRRAKELDPTRLRTFVTNNRDTQGHRAFEEADLVAFNVYVGGYQGRSALHVKEVRDQIRPAAAEHIRRQLSFWPGKPLLVTEFGTPGVPGMHGDVTYTEEYQAALIEEVWKAIAAEPELSGGIVWSWADYYHRRNYIKYAAFGPYGVVTVDRKPKLALSSLMRMYGGAQRAVR